MSKQALCILRKDFEQLINLYNIREIKHPDGEVRLIELYDEGKLEFNALHRVLQDRTQCETDPDFLQLIPYVVVLDLDCNILTYMRGTKGNEDRLHGKHSLGFGGHIEEVATGNLTNLIFDAAKRELEEELGVNLKIDLHLHDEQITLIQSFDKVGQVHLGVYIIVMIDRNQLGQEELDVIVDPKFYSVSEISELVDKNELRFEPWSTGVFSFIENGMFNETEVDIDNNVAVAPI